ncbi:unnamed protein product [Adineta steineri]|uniref:AAA+ ATPase domain-containing protein n=1 Tax=Adineta steineri TaxID=433720 RepID=A0A818K7L1_9BILA|nr:unnamed protein product [Adineta steineri]CAF3557083.1 unnamed protein product [Adineta steineri]
MNILEEKTTGNLYVPKPKVKKVSAPSTENLMKKIEIVNALVLNIRMKYPYKELNKFVDEMIAPSQYLRKNAVGEQLSILQQYALESTREAIDMSNQQVRIIYRPDLSIRKTDSFGVWNFNYLLDMLELDYQCEDTDKQDFPKVWKTTSMTKVRVVKAETSGAERTGSAPQDEHNNVTLLDVLKLICLQNKCDESDAKNWEDALIAENICTVQHLRTVAANDDCWDKLSSVKYFVKQMIRDYILLNNPSTKSKKTKTSDEYSRATLLGDIHRLRRYFHHITKTLACIPNLDQEAVDESMKEMRKKYEDDGNVLSTIYAYLRPFCVKPTVISSTEREQKCQEWTAEQTQLQEVTKKLREDHTKQHYICSIQQKAVELSELGYKNKIEEESHMQRKKETMLEEADKGVNAFSNRRAAQQLEIDYNKEKQLAKEELDAKLEARVKEDILYAKISAKLATYEAQIRDLDTYLRLTHADKHRDLEVKYGRGLLLYGPPGTGKSKLLKYATSFSGITTVTIPLAAGELNRPYVGQTEKLLIDIMNRADTIPYLISAMIIDEIDGLVPKRDNNAQQSKVDGISVLLSHIEGVKDIPNLIILGATNRRNMMDEAFLRRMQKKCFVGRPSPKIRETMLQPLLLKSSRALTSQHIDFLVKITTNFSGAAIEALKGNIVSAIDQCQPGETLTDHAFLTLADCIAREYSCWFGMETLPSIFRLYSNMNSSFDQQEHSLELREHIPSGRILVNLLDQKCVIEFANEEASLELDFQSQETSILTLLSRFINGCSSRNIDTIQIIDLNFLIKNNAFEENQIFELLTTLFLGE